MTKENPLEELLSAISDGVLVNEAGTVMQLTEEQKDISHLLTIAMNEKRDKVTPLVGVISDDLNGVDMLVVMGASLQLLLNAIHQVALDAVENGMGSTVEKRRLDVAAGLCDIILTTMATEQGLEKGEETNGN